MSAAPLTLDASIPLESSDHRELLHEALDDLLLTLHQQRNSGLRDLSRAELPSLYLLKCQYVYGEKSAGKCSMRFILTVSPNAEAGHPAEEHLTLELNVRSTIPCFQRYSARSVL